MHYPDKDRFPDPWTDTETFLEEYCGHFMDSVTTHLYFVTPQLIEKGDIRPLYSFKPYVFSKSLYRATEQVNVLTIFKIQNNIYCRL